MGKIRRRRDAAVWHGSQLSRHIELEADRFGLELTHQNHAAAMVFARDASSGDVAVDWDPFFLIFQTTHPSVDQRIEFANTYRP